MKTDTKNIDNSTDSTTYEATGTWTYSLDAPQGGEGIILLTKNGNEFTGTIKNNRMTEPTALNNITVKGNNISFSYPVNFGGNAFIVEVKTVINKNDMQGVMQMGETRSFNLTGKRSQ